MQHEKNMKYNPKNLYAATKKAFEEILFFYKKKIFKNTKFFNLKFFETYASNDSRNKLVPVIIKNYKNKKITKIISSRLQLNFIHVDDIIKAIIILIEKNINSGEYLIKAKKDTNIFRLINHYNKNKNKKIYYSILSKNKISVDKLKIRKLPYWKQTRILEKDFKTLIYD